MARLNDPAHRWPVRLLPRWGAALLLLLLASGCERMLTRPLLYGTVTAEVLRRNGAPIPGARVVLYTGQRPMGYGTTDSAGRYLFEDVPEGAYGMLAVPPAGYERLERLLATTKPSEVVDQLQMTAGQRLSARVQFLQVGSGAIEAHVREPTGAPIPGLTTVLYSPTGEVRRGSTDAAGRLLFSEVPFGLYGVVVERPAVYRDSGEVALPYVDGLLMEAGAAERAAFTFEKCLGTLAAQVTDQSGRPVTGAQLVLYTDATVLARDSTVLGARNFSGLPCTVYGLRLVPPSGYRALEQRGSAFADGLRIRRNSQLRANLTVQRIPRGSIWVRVTDQGNRPVNDARVVLYNSTGTVRDLRTASDGTVAMDTILMSEAHGVRVVNPRGYLLGEGAGISYVDQLLLADGEQRDLLFRMQRTGRATVELRVISDDNQPVPNTRVVLYTGQGLERDVRTGAEGNVTLSDIIVGPEYGVRVMPGAGYTVSEGRGLSFEDGLRFTDGELRRFTFRFRRIAP